MEKKRIMEVIFSAVDEVNAASLTGKSLEKSVDTVLSGIGGNLDSLGLISLIVAVEQKMDEELGITLPLVDENILSQILSEDSNPFKTIGTLIDYIASNVEGKISA